jgi:hypothetical protein
MRQGPRIVQAPATQRSAKRPNRVYDTRSFSKERVMRVEIQSRTGNAFLGMLGVLYLLASAALLVYDLVLTWGATSLADSAIQIVLILSAAAGAFFAIIALRNRSLRLPHREAPHRREGVVAAR